MNFNLKVLSKHFYFSRNWLKFSKLVNIQIHKLFFDILIVLPGLIVINTIFCDFLLRTLHKNRFRASGKVLNLESIKEKLDLAIAIFPKKAFYSYSKKTLESLPES